MRCLARTSLALFGLTLATPAALQADSPSGQAPMPSPQSTFAPVPSGQYQTVIGQSAPSHSHQIALGRNSCAVCESEAAATQGYQGVVVQTPPGYVSAIMPPTAMPAPVNGQPMMAATAPQPRKPTKTARTKTKRGGAAAGVAVATDSDPGHAVAFSPSYPGEPAPAGFMTPLPSQAMASQGAPYDRSVVPTSIPSAPEPIDSAPHSRPHIVSRVLGITAIGRNHRLEREQRDREKHASIAYDAQTAAVNELPTSVVYSKRMARRPALPQRAMPASVPPGQ